MRHRSHHHSLQFGSIQFCSILIGPILASAALLVTGCGGNRTTTTQHDWVWQGGSQNPTQPGVYGSQEQPATQNIPGARFGSACWTDIQGNFWLFGGIGVVSQQSIGSLSDVWRYSPSNRQWTWVSGPQQANVQPVYGTKGVASTSNIPSGRTLAQTWVDLQGNFWLFSGGAFSDLWKFSPSSGEWTFMGGDTNLPTNAPNKGMYGTLGQPSPSNWPGSRSQAATWTDAEGNLWMYGGGGHDSQGIGGLLGDLWEYSPSIGEWTWMGGSPIQGAPSVYGQKGVASASNTPGARDGSLFWSNGKGDVWLFGGGLTADEVGTGNDLWKYSNGEWTWIAGSKNINQLGIYGSQGNPSPSNNPGSRTNSTTWMDEQGNLWLFGGNGLASQPSFFVELSDLWEFSNGQWIWVGGPNTVVDLGNYGQLGVSNASNLPPARSYACGWVDQSDQLWLFGGSAGLDFSTITWFNDLWEYTP